MITPVSAENLSRLEALSHLISDRIGLDFPERKWDMLLRVVAELALELKFNGPECLLEELLCSPLSETHLNQLISRLTIGETYFLRDKNVFTALRNHILPALIERNMSERRLDLWCAASSTGEEPYSVAMLLDEKKAQLDNWQINFNASDINLEVIKKAREGIYSRWSLRATPDDVNRRYFTRVGENSFLLNQHIRDMVSFSQLNLAEKDFVMPGLSGRLADIIFCRNVLIYFSAELQAQVIKRLVSLLRPGGWLLVSPSELGVVNDPELVSVSFPGVVVHQKVGGVAPSHRGQNLKNGVLKRHFDINPTAANLLPMAPPGRPTTLSGSRRRHKLRSSSVLEKEFSGDDRETDSFKEILIRVKELFQLKLYSEIIDLVFDDPGSSLRRESEYAQLMTYKARALANCGELEAAATFAELGVAADKVDPSVYYFSAVIARERADFEAALSFYRQALFLDADFVMAHFSMATLLRQLGRKGGDKHLRNVVSILESVDLDSLVPEAEGLSAGRLLEIARSLLGLNDE